MILTDELCDKLCAAAREKSKEIGIDISFAVSDENGLPRVLHLWQSKQTTRELH